MTPGFLSFDFSKLACNYRVRMLDSLRGEQRSVANGGTPIRTSDPLTGAVQLQTHEVHRRRAVEDDSSSRPGNGLESA